MKKTIFIFISIFLLSDNVYSNEIIIEKCYKTKSVISKMVDLETAGANEYMHMKAKDGSTAVLIHSYNKKLEKYHGIIAEPDDKFYYYDFVKCDYRFDGNSNKKSGYFFVDKREIQTKNEYTTKKVNLKGKIYTFHEAGTLWYGLKTIDGKDINLGAAFEYMSLESGTCLRKYEEKDIIVNISGTLIIYKDKKVGQSMNPKSVKCF